MSLANTLSDGGIASSFGNLKAVNFSGINMATKTLQADNLNVDNSIFTQQIVGQAGADIAGNVETDGLQLTNGGGSGSTTLLKGDAFVYGGGGGTEYVGTIQDDGFDTFAVKTCKIFSPNFTQNGEVLSVTPNATTIHYSVSNAPGYTGCSVRVPFEGINEKVTEIYVRNDGGQDITVRAYDANGATAGAGTENFTSLSTNTPADDFALVANRTAHLVAFNNGGDILWGYNIY